jgi:hypothetical protein
MEKRTGRKETETEVQKRIIKKERRKTLAVNELSN